MDEASDLTLALYQARLALAQNLFELMLSGRQRWLTLGVELLAADIDEIRAARAELLSAESWPAVAAVWPNAWWRINQHGVTVLEGLARTALTNHTALALETQRAVRQWQQAVMQALHIAGNAMPFHGFWQNTLASLGTVPQAAFPWRLPGDTSTPPHHARNSHEHRDRAGAGG